MAKRIYAAGASACNSGCASAARTSRTRPRWRGGSVPQDRLFDSCSTYNEGALLASRFDDALLEALELAGVASIDALVRMIPGHPHPFRSILLMIEAGSIAMDYSAAFDGDTQLWRLDAAPRL